MGIAVYQGTFVPYIISAIDYLNSIPETSSSFKHFSPKKINDIKLLNNKKSPKCDEIPTKIITKL